MSGREKRRIGASEEPHFSRGIGIRDACDSPIARGRGACMPPRIGRRWAMFNVISLIIGAVALVMALVAFFPLLGWANWLIIPFAVVGLAFGVLSRSTAGRNLNLVVIGIGALRLMLGGGII